MDNFTPLCIACPGCGTKVELEILIIHGGDLIRGDGDWKCGRQCQLISFDHRHAIPNHPRPQRLKITRAVNVDGQIIAIDARARCSWSGAILVLSDVEEDRD